LTNWTLTHRAIIVTSVALLSITLPIAAFRAAAQKLARYVFGDRLRRKRRGACRRST